MMCHSASTTKWCRTIAGGESPRRSCAQQIKAPQGRRQARSRDCNVAPSGLNRFEGHNPVGLRPRLYSAAASRLKQSLQYSLAIGFVSVILVGCSSTTDESSTQPTSAAKRAERRLFPGAPPVIPHPPLSGKCVTCHTPTGSTRPPLGFAPANPHMKTPGMSDESRCKQCHVFQTTQEVFVASTFEPLRMEDVHGPKAHALAPPTIPHHHFMREDCAACHTGPASRPEIRCTHADRARCVQCHAERVVAETLHPDFGERARDDSTPN